MPQNINRGSDRKVGGEHSTWAAKELGQRYKVSPRHNTHIKSNPSIGTRGIPVSIQERLESLRFLYDLEADWDEEGAEKPSKKALDEAFKFIKNLSVRLMKEWQVYLTTPDITPLSDGSVDVLLENDQGHFLINFKEEDDYIAESYYGRLFGDSESVIKGKKVLKHVYVWLENMKRKV